jgi:hypothetical protein
MVNMSHHFNQSKALFVLGLFRGGHKYILHRGAMFWTRAANALTPDPSADARSGGSASVLQSATSRSMGFFAALDARSSTVDNQSAGENAREATANGVGQEETEDDSGALPPSFTLSEQRRQELLRAARATRTSWVDGDRPATDENASSTQWTASTVTGQVPPHCKAAVEQIAGEMQSLLATIEQLKCKILPHDVLSRTDLSDDSHIDDNNQTEQLATVTIVEELRTHRSELERWRRVHVVDGHLSPLQRKRLTASDKESLFLLAFQELLTLLRHPLAAEIVYQIQTFVRTFDHWDLEAMMRHRALPERPGGRVQSFIDRLVRQLQRTGAALFQAVGVEMLSLEEDDEQLLHEVVEAFLLEKLHLKAMTPSSRTEQEDEQLRDRLTSLRTFVTFRHLDLPTPANEEIEREWTSLIEQLAMLSRFPSPRRQVDCVLRVCQGLTSLLARLDGSGKFPSADEFLPALIYVLLHANPPRLKRTVEFILEYRRPSRLVSEPGYFFTHLVSSVAFLEQVNGELLTITPEEFEAGLKRSREQVAANVAAAAEAAVQGATRVASDDTKRENHGEPSRNIVDGAVAVVPHLPTVLEVRAKRLATLTLSA